MSKKVLKRLEAHFGDKIVDRLHAGAAGQDRTDSGAERADWRMDRGARAAGQTAAPVLDDQLEERYFEEAVEEETPAAAEGASESAQEDFEFTTLPDEESESVTLPPYIRRWRARGARSRT